MIIQLMTILMMMPWEQRPADGGGNCRMQDCHAGIHEFIIIYEEFTRLARD